MFFGFLLKKCADRPFSFSRGMGQKVDAVHDHAAISKPPR